VSFAEVVERQQDAVFRRLGEDATWSGIADPVRIRFAERDDSLAWSEGRTVALVRFVRVRRSEVASPAIGDVIVRTEQGGQQLEVIETPTLDRKGVWLMGVKEL
jgi:hypothetical protein